MADPLSDDFDPLDLGQPQDPKPLRLVTGAPEAQEPNPYVEQIRARREREGQLLLQRFSAAAKFNPDEAGEAQRLGPPVGLDSETAARNLDELRELHRVREAKARLLSGADPILRRQLADFEFAKIAHDDLPQLSTLESITANFEVGELTVERGYLGERLRAGVATDQEIARVTAIEEQLAKLPARPGGFLPGASRIIGQLASTLPSAADFAVQGGMVAATATAIAGQLGPQVALPEEIATVPAAFVTGATAGALSAMAVQSYRIEAGNAYLDMIRPASEGGPGLDPRAAASAARGVGLVNAALEVVGVGIVTKPIRSALTKELTRGVVEALSRPTLSKAAGKFALDYAKGVGGEAATEVLQEVSNIVGEERARSASGKESQFDTPEGRAAIAERLSSTLVDTLQGMALLAAPGPVYALHRDTRRAQQAERAGEFFDQLAKGSTESKVRDRNPDAFQRFVAATTDGTPIENIYVDGMKLAETLQQAGLTPTQLEQAVPGLQTRVQEAVASGGDVVVPTAEYQARIAGTPLDAALRPHLRLGDPDAFSLAESEAFLQPGKGRAEELGKQVEERMRTDEAFAASARVVEMGMREQLIAAGRTKARAGHEAKFWREGIALAAARTGMTPEEFQAKHAPLRVVAATVDKYDTVPFQPGLEQPGQPPIVFHGTDADFDTFDAAKEGTGQGGGGQVPGFWFASDAKVAAGFGKRRIAARVKLRNPLRIGAAEYLQRFRYDGEDPVAFRREAEAKGHDGLIIEADPEYEGGRGPAGTAEWGQTNFVAFSPEQIETVTFDPKDPNVLRAGETSPRGGFDPARFLIGLTPDADATTFLHEVSHAFLHIYAALAAQPNAPAVIVEDFQAFLDWRGIKDVAAWHAMTLEQQRKHHEAFAYNFEIYLFDNEAPSPQMRTLFQRAKAWLIEVYKGLVRETVTGNFRREFGEDLPTLSPEVRRMMDRMFASEQAAARAETVRGLIPAFEAREQFPGTDAEWTKYQQDLEEQRAALGEQLTKESLQALGWLKGAKGRKLKALQKERAADRETLRAEVEAELRAQPVHRAREWLETGKVPNEDGTTAQGDTDPVHKLRTEDVQRILGEGARVPAGIARKDGHVPDTVAPVFGFETGEQMVRALVETPKLKDAVEARLTQVAEERFGQIDEAAVDRATATEARARFVATQVRALRGLAEPVRETMQAARAAALRMLDRMKLAEMRPARFASASRRAASVARDAVAKGDMQTAGDAKLQELVQHYLAIESRQAIQEWEGAKRKFRNLDRPDDRLAKSRDVNLVGAARAILAAYRLGPGPAQAHAHLEKVAEYDPDLYAELKPMVDRATQDARDHRTMRLAELRDLRDAVLSLWERSLRERQVEFGAKKELRAEVIAKLKEAFRQFGVPEDVTRHRDLTQSERRRRDFGSLKAALRHVESWAIEVDGGKPGVVHRYLFDLLRKPFDLYMLAKNAKVREVHDALAKLDIRDGKIAAPELEYTFTNQAHLLGALQHMGNESNLRKNTNGRGWAQDRRDGTHDATRWWQFVRRMVAEGKVTKEHLDFVQHLWDVYASLKPEAQRAHFENYGYYFDEVEVKAFTIAFPDGSTKTYRGGYVPAKPDPDTQPPQAGQRSVEGITETAQTYAETRATTGKGFTITRTDVTRPLEMDIRRVAFNLDEELRFIYLQRPGRDLNSLLKDKEVRAAIHAIDPRAITEMFEPWLADTMKNRVMAPGGEPTLNKFLVAARRNTAIAYMFGNLANALQQVTGFATSSLYVKLRHLRAAASLYARGGLGAKVAGMSDFMRLRLEQQVGQLVDDIDVLLSPTWLGKAQGWTQRNAYFLQRWMQNPVDVITWQGAFEQSVAEGRSEADAIRDADAVVRRSQGSGTAADLSKFERGTALVRVMTQFGSFWIATFNTLAQRHGLQRARAAAVVVLFAGVAAAAIKKALEGGWDDEDEDGTAWDDFGAWVFGESLQTGAAAGAPVVGPALMRLATGESAGRLSFGAAFGALEAAVHAVTGTVRVWTDEDKDFAGKNVRDIATLVSLLRGLPITLLARPIGYEVDVGRGEITPTGAFDRVRGWVTGRASPASTR